MPLITFDTCIFIKYQPSYLPKGFRMTAVVLQELTVGAQTDKEVKAWNEVRKIREKDGSLLVPNGEDWWLAGKVLNSLLRGLKSTNKGKTPKLSDDEIQRIIRDTLIARVCKREGVALVTDNLDDFKKIRNFCNVKIISGDDFFVKK